MAKGLIDGITAIDRREKLEPESGQTPHSEGCKETKVDLT